MPNQAQTDSIEEFLDALSMQSYIMNNVENPNWGKNDFLVSIRAFLWFRHETGIKFIDLYEAHIAVMPIMGGAIAFLESQEEVASYIKKEINSVAKIMSEYLDSADFAIEDDQDPASVISMGCYQLLNLYDEYENLTLVDKSSVAKKKHEELLNNPTTSKTLLEILQKEEKERIEYLKELHSKLAASKNVVYNMIRCAGNKVLDTIDSVIYDLYSTDADYILHGLDAFPEDEKVIEFYDSFFYKTNSPYLKKQVLKYRDRVEKGIKTTGWEQ